MSAANIYRGNIRNSDPGKFFRTVSFVTLQSARHRWNVKLTLPSASLVIKRFQILTLQSHIENNAYVKCWFVYEKLYGQVIEDTVYDYLRQKADSRESVRDMVLKRNAFQDSSQSTVFTLLLRSVSLTDPCDRQMYTVNFDTTSTGTPGVLVPFFED